MKGQIVYIESQCRLSLSNHHLVYRTETEEKSFLLADLSAVVFESPMISVTLALFNELQANGVIVLLCDSRKFPSAMLMPLFGIKLWLYGFAFGNGSGDRLSWLFAAMRYSS